MAKHARSAPAGFTVSADLVRGIIDCAVTCGLPRARFADLLKGERRRSSSARYGGEHIVRVWERLLRLSGDPIIGFRMALVAGLKTFGVLGQIAPRCPTVFEACKQTERFSALASQGAHITVTTDATSLNVSVAVDLANSPVRWNVVLWGLTNLALMPKRLTGVDIRPQVIACGIPSPNAVAIRTLKQHFPFTFDASHNRVAFDRRVGDLAIPSADSDLQALLAEVMARHLEDLGPAGSFEQGLMTIVREMMNGTMPTLSSLSARAGMSRRTLQRRLHAANTSFQQLLQRVLREEAEGLLARGTLTQGEIAFLLGYSEVSAFSRAYRGWTGHPPGAAYG